LGCVFCELVTGKARTWSEIQSNPVLKQEIENELTQECSMKFAKLVMAMLNPEPKFRYSAQGVLQALNFVAPPFGALTTVTQAGKKLSQITSGKRKCTL
jgi:hypothetical protein